MSSLRQFPVSALARASVRRWWPALVWALDAAGVSAVVGGLSLAFGMAPAAAWTAGLAAFGVLLASAVAFQLGRSTLRAATQGRLDSERLKYLMLGSVQGVVIHRDHKAVFTNESYARMFGFDSPDQLLRLDSLLELVTPRYQELLQQRAKDRLAGKDVPSRYEFQGIRRDGRRIWVETFAMRVPWEDGHALQSTAIDITERKVAEEALRLSEVAHRSLFEANRRILDHSPAGIVLIDENLRVLYENAATRAIMGLPPDAHSGSPGLVLSEVPLFRNAPAASLIGKLRQNKKITLEIAYTNPKGVRFHLSVQAVPIVEEERLTGAVVLVNDVTERREYEEALRRQDVLLKVLAEARSHLVFTPDLDRAISQVLASLGTHLGVDRVLLYRRETAENAPARAILSHEWRGPGVPALPDAWRDAAEDRPEDRGWWQALSAGQPVHGPAGQPAGTSPSSFPEIGARAFITVPVRREGNLSGFLSLLDHRLERHWSPAEREILLAVAESLGHCIERRATQELARANEEHFSRLTANLPGMIFQCVLHPGGARTFPYVSPQGLRILGFDGERLRQDGEPMFGIIHPTDRIVFERILHEAARTLQPKRWDGRYYLPTGEQRWAQVLAHASRLGDGGTLLDGLLLDITKRKRKELEIVQARERDTLSAWSRELNDEWYPAIKRIEEILAQAASSASADPNNREGALRALELARRLLRQFEVPRPAQAPIPPAAVLREVIGTTLRGTNVEYKLEVSPDVDRIAADADAVREILANLMVLSLQAMPRGGHLSIEAGNVKTQGRAAGLEPGYYVRITVRDEHKGLDAAIWRELLGQGGSAPKEAGGLAALLAAVTAEKGWLTAQGDPGKGPLFTLYLPSSTLALVPAQGKIAAGETQAS